MLNPMVGVARIRPRPICTDGLDEKRHHLNEMLSEDKLDALFIHQAHDTHEELAVCQAYLDAVAYNRHAVLVTDNGLILDVGLVESL